MNEFTYEQIEAMLNPAGVWGYTAPPTMRLRASLVEHGRADLAPKVGYTFPAQVGPLLSGIGVIPAAPFASQDEVIAVSHSASVVFAELCRLRGHEWHALDIIVNVRGDDISPADLPGNRAAAPHGSGCRCN